MNLNDKIYIAGHRGLVGSAVLRNLESKGFNNILVRNHQDLDLTNQTKVKSFFDKEKPDYVILAAAKVGGIYANNTYPADFIYQNTMIETNIIHSAFKNKVKRLLFLGSTCIYPKDIEQPMREDTLLSDKLEPTNEPYALSKILGIKLCESYNRQHGTDFRSVMPTNLYGINDNFEPDNSHVIPGLMQRFHNAKINNDKEVMVWGTGNAMREFLFVDDMAEASLFVLGIDKEIYDANTLPMISHINVGSGKDITIKELAEIMKEVVGFEGKISFDNSKPDGSARKLIDVSRLSKMGWKNSTSLREGLEHTYNWYKNNLDNA
tara:strand:- start:67 stop:1029 length:963 start_codon:yes stop_codon:yes gene_type:complete